MPRLDRFRQLHPTLPPDRTTSAERDPDSPRDPELRSYRSGFWATVPIRPRRLPGALELSLEARLANGETERGALGTIEIVERPETRSYDRLLGTPGQPLIAICMATFNPDLELFRAQVESIRAQTHRNWICLISDDCSEPEQFEAIARDHRGRRAVPALAGRESPGLLPQLRTCPDAGPPRGRADRPQRPRRPLVPGQARDPEEAIGSARSGLQRREAGRRRRPRARGDALGGTAEQPQQPCLAPDLEHDRGRLVPVPPRGHRLRSAIPGRRQDGTSTTTGWRSRRWRSGDVAYVDRPLYDYVQHPRAVLGHAASMQEPSQAARPGLRARLGRRRGFSARWRSIYFFLYLQRDFHARVLLARCADELTARKRRALRLVVDAARSPIRPCSARARPARALFSRNETLGVEALLVRGILWRHLISLRTWSRERPEASEDDARACPPFDPGSLGPQTATMAGPAMTDPTPGGDSQSVESRVIWLFGSPRSGSTWLRRMADEHPAIEVMNEPTIGYHLSPFLSNEPGLSRRGPRRQHLHPPKSGGGQPRQILRDEVRRRLAARPPPAAERSPPRPPGARGGRRGRSSLPPPAEGAERIAVGGCDHARSAEGPAAVPAPRRSRRRRLGARVVRGRRMAGAQLRAHARHRRRRRDSTS